MKVNWFGAFPVIQSRLHKKKERKVEPTEKSDSLNNNEKEEDNYSVRRKENDKERQDMLDYWKVFWKI
tara:strand:- start:220 stop:423 length:204 start_codon:yes stop_codon:yes gene_type:complete